MTPGDVARVPAHVVQWLENRGPEPLRAVAAYASSDVATQP